MGPVGSVLQQADQLCELLVLCTESCVSDPHVGSLGTLYNLHDQPISPLCTISFDLLTA